MDGLTYVPLLAFTIISFLFIYVSIDEFIERGFSFSNLARCLLKVGGSGLFFIPAAYILFGETGAWYTVIVVTALLLLGMIAALIGEITRPQRADKKEIR